MAEPPDTNAIKKKLAELKKQEQNLDKETKEYNQAVSNLKTAEKECEKEMKEAAEQAEAMENAIKEAQADCKVLNDISKSLDKISYPWSRLSSRVRPFTPLEPYLESLPVMPPTIEELQAEVDRLTKLLTEMANSKAGEAVGRKQDTANDGFQKAKRAFTAASKKVADTLKDWQTAIDQQRAALEALLDDPSDANVAAEAKASKACETALAAKDKAKDDLDEAQQGVEKAQKAVDAAGEKDTKFFAMLERIRKLQGEAKADLEAALKGNNDKNAKDALAKVKKL